MRGILTAILAAALPLAATAGEVVLSSKEDGVELRGNLIEFADGVYRIETVIGEITISADKVNCAGPGCTEVAPPAPELRASPGEQVTIITENGSVRLTGTLVSFANDTYEIDTNIGRLEILAEGTECEGPGCPVPVIAEGAVDVVGTPAAATEPAPDQPAPATLLPADTDFLVPVARLDAAPALQIAGAASVIEGLLPQIAAAMSADGTTVSLSDSAETGFTAAAETGAPAGSLGLEVTAADGSASSILARLSTGTADETGADITFLAAPAGAATDAAARLLGYEPLVPIVSRQNPLFAISAEDLSAVFGGTIRNWTAVGGQDRPIRVLGLAPPHDLTVALQTLVLAPYGRSLTQNADRLATTSALVDAVLEDDGAIAFVGASMVGDAKVLGLLDSCGTPVAASASAVKSGRYPFARQVLVDARTSDGLAGTLLASLDRVIDGGGAALIAPGTTTHPLDDEIGQVRDSLNRIDDRLARLSASNALGMMAVADKLSVSVGFRDASNRVDDNTDAVLDAVLDYAGDKELTEIFLVGFSEDTGDVDRNHEMGRSAAGLVAQRLAAADTGKVLETTLVRTIGLGAIAPVACGEERRFQNRRVEVWVRH